MDWRIRQNGLAHSPKWIAAFAKMDKRMHDTLYMCIYSSWLGAFAAWIYAHVWCIMHALAHFSECASPFWRMRQFILLILEIRLGRDTGNLLEIGNPISVFEIPLGRGHSK